LQANCPAFEVRDVADAFLRGQFETTDLHARQHRDRLAAASVIWYMPAPLEAGL